MHIEVTDTVEALEVVTGDEDAREAVAQDDLVEAELLVEEISIDGMCGVY